MEAVLPGLVGDGGSLHPVFPPTAAGGFTDCGYSHVPCPGTRCPLWGGNVKLAGVFSWAGVVCGAVAVLESPWCLSSNRTCCAEMFQG